MTTEETNSDRGLVPEGVYRAKVARWEWISNDEGSLSICVELTTHNGRAVTFYGSASQRDPNGRGSAWDVTEKALQAMGWNGEIEGIQLDRSRVFNIEIEHDVWENRVRARVRGVWASPIDTKAAPRELVQQLAQLLGRGPQ
jgi:hypothetical protein